MVRLNGAARTSLERTAPEESPEEFQVTQAVFLLKAKAFARHRGLWEDS